VLHQKVDIALDSDSQVDFGSLKQDIAYTGIAIAIDLSRIYLPPCDNVLANQPVSLFFSLSWI